MCLYYNNNVECHHYREKLEQCFQTLSSCDVIDTLLRLTERQQSDEVKALYRSGPYSLSNDYVKFKVDSLNWHSWSPEARRKHVAAFRNHEPTLSDHFKKPKTSGRKHSQSIRKSKCSPDIVVDETWPSYSLMHIKSYQKGCHEIGIGESHFLAHTSEGVFFMGFPANGMVRFLF